MKHVSLRHNDRAKLKKAEAVLEGTVVHRYPFEMRDGMWEFVVIGPNTKGMSVLRAGYAEQARVQTAPVYIATVGGEQISEGYGVPVEEFAGDGVPEELAGLKIFHLSPLRPLAVTARREGPPVQEALAEALEQYKGNNTAIIETPDEAYWALSVLKYLDESDRFFPDPVLTNFYSRLGYAPRHTVH